MPTHVTSPENLVQIPKQQKEEKKNKRHCHYKMIDDATKKDSTKSEGVEMMEVLETCSKNRGLAVKGAI